MNCLLEVKKLLLNSWKIIKIITIYKKDNYSKFSGKIFFTDYYKNF